MWANLGRVLRCTCRDGLAQERGVTSIEYALVAWLIAIALVAGLLVAGGAVGTLWDNIGDCVASWGKSCRL